MLAAALIFLFTLVLVIWQPRGLGIGWSAMIGAALALLLGVVHIGDIQAVWHIVWNATAAFIAIIIISLLLDEAGFFEWAALHVARWGDGRGLRLFAFIVLRALRRGPTYAAGYISHIGFTILLIGVIALGRYGEAVPAELVRALRRKPTQWIGPAPAAAEKPSLPQPRAPVNIEQLLAGRPEQRVPMSRLRQRVAERLVQSQSTAAILTTFNEVNMAPVMELRKKYQERFEREHGVRLGFMSFFVKASVHALKRFPVVNASVDGTDIVYHGYFDIGIAVGSPRGLVVPILRDADRMGFAEIEKRIGDFGKRAQDGKLAIEELTGGTFSISNGGVFGSMLSTPIINPPQSAILGVHLTKDRAVVENGQIVIRPMNYLALSYDHRIIDGREAVLFLIAVKEALEDPARLVLEI